MPALSKEGGQMMQVQIPEKEINRAVINELRIFHGLGKLSYFVNLEGEYRNGWQRRSAKRHGIRAGRPDIEIFLHGGVTVFIELKTLKGRLSASQEKTHKELKRLDHDVRTIYAQDAVVATKSLHKILADHGVTL